MYIVNIKTRLDTNKEGKGEWRQFLLSSWFSQRLTPTDMIVCTVSKLAVWANKHRPPLKFM